MLGVGSRRYWVVGAVGWLVPSRLVVSQLVIGSAWRDAWAGTTANADARAAGG